jgi:hypothetical protein
VCPTHQSARTTPCSSPTSPPVFPSRQRPPSHSSSPSCRTSPPSTAPADHTLPIEDRGPRLSSTCVCWNGDHLGHALPPPLSGPQLGLVRSSLPANAIGWTDERMSRPNFLRKSLRWGTSTLLTLGGLWSLNLAAYHGWASAGPPTPRPEWHRLLFQRWAMVAALAFAGAGLAVWWFRPRSSFEKNEERRFP